MPSLVTSILLFIPLFLMVNIIAAVPGRDDLKEAVRLGLRHAVFGAIGIIAASVALHYAIGFLIDRPPLFS